MSRDVHSGHADQVARELKRRARAGVLAIAAGVLYEASSNILQAVQKGTPTVDLVGSVAKQVDALHLQDATLAIYAKNYQATLVVLSKTLELKAGPSAPDGTDAVVQLNLKAARTDADDVQRYCAP